MTEAKCLSGCQKIFGHGDNATYIHAPGCSKAAEPKYVFVCGICGKPECEGHITPIEPKAAEPVKAAPVKHDGWSCGCGNKLACELAEEAQNKAKQPAPPQAAEPVGRIEASERAMHEYDRRILDQLRVENVALRSRLEAVEKSAAVTIRQRDHAWAKLAAAEKEREELRMLVPHQAAFCPCRRCVVGRTKEATDGKQ